MHNPYNCELCVMYSEQGPSDEDMDISRLQLEVSLSKTTIQTLNKELDELRAYCKDLKHDIDVMNRQLEDA